MNNFDKESYEALLRLQDKLKKDPEAVKRILISAKIIDEDGQLTKEYGGKDVQSI